MIHFSSICNLMKCDSIVHPISYFSPVLFIFRAHFMLCHKNNSYKKTNKINKKGSRIKWEIKENIDMKTNFTFVGKDRIIDKEKKRIFGKAEIIYKEKKRRQQITKTM